MNSIISLKRFATIRISVCNIYWGECHPNSVENRGNFPQIPNNNLYGDLSKVLWVQSHRDASQHKQKSSGLLQGLANVPSLSLDPPQGTIFPTTWRMYNLSRQSNHNFRIFLNNRVTFRFRNMCTLARRPSQCYVAIQTVLFLNYYHRDHYFQKRFHIRQQW